MVASRSSITPNEPTETTELSWPCLLLRIGTRWCGLRAEAITEVVAPEAITKVPGQPSHVLGVSLVHGRLVPVIDLAPLMPELGVSLEHPNGRRLAVITHGESEIGLVADDAKGVIELPVPDHDSVTTTRPSFVQGEVRWEDQLVCLIDVNILAHMSMGTT